VAFFTQPAPWQAPQLQSARQVCVPSAQSPQVRVWLGLHPALQEPQVQSAWQVRMWQALPQASVDSGAHSPSSTHAPQRPWPSQVMVPQLPQGSVSPEAHEPASGGLDVAASAEGRLPPSALGRQNPPVQTSPGSQPPSGEQEKCAPARLTQVQPAIEPAPASRAKASQRELVGNPIRGPGRPSGFQQDTGGG
jgi:hypothetical protein